MILAAVLVVVIFIGLDMSTQKPVKTIEYQMKAGESVYSVLSRYAEEDYNVNELRDRTAHENDGISISNVNAGQKIKLVVPDRDHE